jgi:hypothetical protein
MHLSAAHRDAVDRRRRIVVQYDAYSNLGGDFDAWLDYRFRYVDEPGSQIDALWWDIGGGQWATYPSTIIPSTEHPGLVEWWEQGIDWVQSLVDATRKRGLEVFWNHRVSEVDIPRNGDGLEMQDLHPLKAAHPDWVTKTWWWQGLWDYSVAELREFQVSVIRELQEKYRFDGFQIDFARHVPCLPVGRQWELRDHVTEFVRMVREMLLDLERAQGQPILLAVRVPGDIQGCRVDGFDVEAWAREDLVDIFTLGSRTMDIDLPAYRRIVAGHNIKLQPCLDDHHATDAYQYPSIEFFRGVFGNWWDLGADSVMTFNWSNAPAEDCRRIGALPGPESQRQAYHEIGAPETLAGRDKTFAVERRGGYPWAEGYFNRNDTAPLPAILANNGAAMMLPVRCCDPVDARADQVKDVRLRVILFGARDGDEFAAEFNGEPLQLLERDADWKDAQVFSPAPQPPSGGADFWQVNPDQRLLRLDFAVPPTLCHHGGNRAGVSITHRIPYLVDPQIVLEKLELHVRYGPA